MMSPVFDKVADENKDFEFVKVNADTAKGFCKIIGVKGIPTFLSYKGSFDINCPSAIKSTSVKKDLEEFLHNETS